MKNTWHKFQRYYFTFSRSDRNGITILAIAIFVVLVGIVILPYLVPQQKEDFSEIRAVFKAWESEQNDVKATKQLTLFEFNPNSIDDSELGSLNLPFFVKQNMVRYRDAGGKFKNVDDFRKIYGMTDSVFQIIRPYILIEKSQEKEIPSGFAVNLKKEQTNISNQIRNVKQEPGSSIKQIEVELNSADTTDLIQLPGIGPVFSKRIIKYRDLLGGFVKKEQLLEVYNFPSETFENISDMLTVDSTLVKKLRINFLEYSDLLRHPYLNKEQVGSIINRRDTDGPFKNLSEVASIQVFDSESFARIRPYLTCK